MKNIFATKQFLWGTETYFNFLELSIMYIQIKNNMRVQEYVLSRHFCLLSNFESKSRIC